MTRKVFIDSNYLVRAVSLDDKKQLDVVRTFFKEVEDGKIIGLVSILVIAEVVWVLEHHYKLERKVFVPLLLELIALSGIKILEVKKSVVAQVLERMLHSKIDLTDLYLAEVAGKSQIATFDKELLRVN